MTRSQRWRPVFGYAVFVSVVVVALFLQSNDIKTNRQQNKRLNHADYVQDQIIHQQQKLIVDLKFEALQRNYTRCLDQNQARAGILRAVNKLVESDGVVDEAELQGVAVFKSTLPQVDCGKEPVRG